MRWNEFAICVFLDIMFGVYIYSCLTSEVEVRLYAKIIFGIMCVLLAIGTRVTYKEMREGYNG